MPPKPTTLIVGMMNTRAPEDFLEPFTPLARDVIAVTIPGEPNAHKARRIADAGRSKGFTARAVRSIAAAIDAAAETGAERVVICGSLYLAGQVLHRNGTPPH